MRDKYSLGINLSVKTTGGLNVTQSTMFYLKKNKKISEDMTSFQFNVTNKNEKKRNLFRKKYFDVSRVIIAVAIPNILFNVS
jgi:Flp pilus assembly protein TadG